MNDTASAGGATGASLIPSTTDAFTIAHLAVVAVFAILVIAAIVWGSRLKRRRKAAERDIADHNAEVAHTSRDAAVADEPRAAAPSFATDAGPRDAAPAHAPEDEPATVSPPIADQPIAASAPLDAAPAIEAASAPVASTDEPAVPDADTPGATDAGSPAGAPVTTLKGLGPKLAVRLGELGITTVGQIATLSDDEAARLDAQLGPFAGRITRDRWIEQARFLAAGDRAGFEAVFGRL